MSDINIQARHPFGPSILEVDCPMDLINSINNLVDNMDDKTLEMCSSKHTHNPNFPNLLNRGFEIIYLLKEQAQQLTLDSFIVAMSQQYLNYLGRPCDTLNIPAPDWDSRYSDVWINRYFKGDITPPHGHNHYLSGVIVLKLPENIPDDLDVSDRPDRSLEFNHNDEPYLPEQKVGKMYIFPSHLRHWVHFHVCEEERRTVSFNVGV